MRRDLYCRKCASNRQLHPDDVRDGYVTRQVPVIAKLPPNLYIEVGPMDGPRDKILVTELVCDLCNDAIPNGTVAMAITTWNIHREGTPVEWEKEYGEVI